MVDPDRTCVGSAVRTALHKVTRNLLIRRTANTSTVVVVLGVLVRQRRLRESMSTRLAASCLDLVVMSSSWFVFLVGVDL